MESFGQTENREVQPDLNVMEQDFYNKLTSLPEDLAKTWQLKYEDLEDFDNEASIFFEEFKTFFVNRSLVLAGTSLEIHEDVESQKIREEILAVHESIKNTFGNPNYFLGNGATAEVYTLPIAQDICVKYISNQEKYNENNHLRKEYEFLDELHKFETLGVRTPHPYFLRIHPSEGHSYGMERIKGENLSRILEEPSKNVNLIKMLKKTDRNQAERNLVEFVKKLHREFSITHNDLFQRNIMVNDSGDFFIIDFGKAKKEEVGEDHDLYYKSDIVRVTTSIKHFFKRLDEIDINDIVKEDSSNPLR